jgi:uncharacterized protein
VLPDINLLVAAHRADHPQHEKANAWLRQTLAEQEGDQRIVLTMQVISGFLRLVTNERIFQIPSSSSLAIDFIDWLLEDKRVRLLSESTEWDSFRSLILEKGLVANQVPDAHLAALAISLSEPFVTFDKGFKQLLPRSLLVLLPGV